MIVAVIAVAIVVCGSLVRRLRVEDVQPAKVEEPLQSWDATSTQRSFAADDSIETSELPPLPVEQQWEISSLPAAEQPLQFQPLPSVEDAEDFELAPLPKLDASTDLEIQPLPAMDGADEANKGEADDFNSSDSSEAMEKFQPLPMMKRDDLDYSSTPRLRPQQIHSPVYESVTTAVQASSPAFDVDDQLAIDFSGELDEPVGAGAIKFPLEFPVTLASAQIEIAPPQASGFAGASVGALPKELADRIAAIAPTAKPTPAAKPKPKAKASAKTKAKKKVVAAPKKGDKKPPKKTSPETTFKLAAQPKFGDHYVDDTPVTDPGVHLLEPSPSDFSGDALNPYLPYDPYTQMNVYQGKTLNANQRPLVELGRPWYQLGQLSPGSSVFGFHNNVTPQFLIFGDARTAYASNRQNGDSTSLIASQLNLDFDLKLTGTERFHAFVSPTGGAQNSRYLLDEDRYVFEGDADIDFGYFEGDLGAIVGGAIGKTLPFDLPFTLGIIPLVVQNGIWLEDAFLGVAATLPARNSPRLNISNADFTFFAGYDKIDSDAFPGDDSAARVIGFASFIDAFNGYIEADYAFLDDRTFDDRSYHNIGIGYTRRYGRFLSNSTRVIVNAGQSTDVVENTADGVLLLSENSLITGYPSNVVPYFNMFAGFDRPQSVARARAAGGVLRNTGILFESDNLTGFPTLDATANDTYGFAAGINLLAENFGQQLVLETALLGVMGDAATRNAQGDQYGIGFRYQLPLSNSVIFRADGMMGFLRNDEDVSGVRLEVRKKF